MKTKDFYPFNYKSEKQIIENKCVIKVPMGNLCGYVALNANDIPKEWHGNYNADGLQYLKIHGGITYCEFGINEKEYKIITERRNEKMEIARNKIKTKEDYNKYSEEVKRVNLWERKEKAKLDYEFIVFGFDCAHYKDESDPKLRDFDYVMKLCEQMEDQLILLSSKYDKYKESSKEKRCEILDEIRQVAKIETEAGIGEMLGLLGGGMNL